MALEIGSQTLETQDVTPESCHASNVLDAKFAILAALNCPPKVRPMMSALFAQTAGRSTTISFTRADVARRLYGGPSALPADDLARACQRVTDDLGRMADWVHSEGLGDAVRYTPGTKDAPGRIQTRLVGWVADLATAADGALSPTADDRARRTYFRQGAQQLVGRRLRRNTPSNERPKRKPTRGAILRQGLSLLRAYVQLSASFGQDVETATGFLHNEIDRVMSSLCQVISCEETAPDEPPNDTLATPKKGDGGNGKNLTEKRNTCQENSGQDQQEGRVQGGGSMPAVAYFDAMAADCGAMAGSVVDGPADEPDAPPLAPHLSADLTAILAAASGRTEQHWRALYAAVSVGALPVAVCIGGHQEPRRGGQGWRIGQESSPGAMTLREFIRGFDELTARARRSGLSFIPTFDKLIIRDDCTLADAQRLRDLALIVTETSPDSYHVLMVVEGIDTEAQVRGFHAALDARGIGGNIGPRVGAARWAGTWNGKRGCDVRLVHSNPGRVLTVEELQALGIVLPAALPAEPIATHRGAHQKPMASNLAQPRGASWRTWPSYDKAIFAKDGDRSAADASFFRRSWNQGFDVEEIADRLMSVSDRAQERGRPAIGKELASLLKRTKGTR